MISAEPSFPGTESSAAGISLPVFFMRCLRSEPPVSHKPPVLATVPERPHRGGGASAARVPIPVHTYPQMRSREVIPNTAAPCGLRTGCWNECKRALSEAGKKLSRK
jgi:hypothetical protein